MDTTWYKAVVLSAAGCGAVLVCAVTVLPSAAHAQEIGYEPRTLEERIAFLFGMIAQLQAQVNALETGEREEREQDRSSSRRYRLDIETRSATDIEEDEAELRGEVDLRGAPYAYVWFEYGERGDLDERTTRRRVTDSRGDEHRYTAMAEDLDEDERYQFRAVAESPDGRRYYGTTRSFTTDEEDRDRDDDDDDDSDDEFDDEDFELSISDRTIDRGDEIEADYRLPEAAARTGNWVGLYETGDSDRQYKTWKYIREDRGSVSFTVEDEGRYELRLFLNNGYDQVARSRSFEVG